MRRRDFIKVIVGSATAWPRAARAQQQTAKPLIGFLNSASPISYTPMIAKFQDGLNELGFDSHNVAFEYHCAEGDYDLLPWFATTLVNHKVVAIISGGGPRMRFAQIERELRANEDRWGAVFANPFMGISVL